MTRIAIIGAGLSGLAAAHLLKDYAEITIFEKAHGVCGRMSTRRAKPYYFDHGAQYFTTRTKSFQDFIQPLLDQGIIERWNARYIKFRGNQVIEKKNWCDEEPRYVGVPGMNHPAKFLAKGLSIHLNTRIVSLNHRGTWQLKDNQDQKYSDFDWVICTVPSPQAEELIPKCFKYYADIKAVEMRPCFSLMLGFKQRLPIDFEAAHITKSDLSWIAVNSHKPQRPDPFTLVVHSSEDYAEKHIDDDRDQVMQHLINETSRIVGQDVSHANYKTIHGWRYANNADKKKKNSLFIDQKLKLAACGDWCLGGRVEGAFTSAYELTKHIKESIL
ncbi:MAG: FAD-dependent oxidoreductase [Endozoicomonas sp. (ex Botrylloides leachii)]|nr:FAD-dependent oxidoreductase [Endozoicomonas sp. (ex Botrylloides leachii)]